MLDVREIVCLLLSTLPVGIVSEVLPLKLPLATLIGKVILKGAPVGTTAFIWFVPTFSSTTDNDIGSVVFPLKSTDVRVERPSKIPAGRLLSWLLLKSSVDNESNPAKSSLCSDVIDLLLKSSDVIVARSASVTLLQSVTFGTAAVIASATGVVRLQIADFAITYPK